MKKILALLYLVFYSAVLFGQTPTLLKDIIPGAIGGFTTAGQFGYYYHPFTIVWEHNNEIFFTANNAALNPGSGTTNDIELWKSDGTAAGTVLLKDIYPGNLNGSDPRDFVEVNGILYFTANTPAHGRELWKTDGTSAGTEMVHDIIGGNVGGFSEAGQFGYYDLNFNVVWKNGNNFYFTANSAALNPGGSYTNDIELWVSDGTSAGTMMLKDINPGNTSGSYPIDFKEINGTLFFTAVTSNEGRELWRSDGTNGGTYLVKDIIPGSVGGFSASSQFIYDTHYFNVVWQNGSDFYFTANNNASVPGGSYTNDIELWKSDGTNGGTSMVKDIYSGSTNSSYPADFTLINGTLFFTAESASAGRELWKTDGTGNGTVMVKDIISGNVGGFTLSSQFAYYAHTFQVVWQSGNKFYFTANNWASAPGGSYTNDIELFESDGTDAGTVMLKDIYAGNMYGSDPADFTVINGTLYFTATSNLYGRELWKTDGTNAGTELVKDINPGNIGGFTTAQQFGYYYYSFKVVWQTGNTFYFTANSAAMNSSSSYTNDIELWKSDGTPGGTMMVKDIYAGNTNSSEPYDFNAINGVLYFSAYNNVSGRELWKTDGSTTGTELVKEIAPGNLGGLSTAGQFGYYGYPFYSPFSIGSEFYFLANDNPYYSGSYTNNMELWKSNGSNGGTVKVIEIYPGNTQGCDAEYFSLALNKVFFTANDPVNGRELWVMDNATSTGINEILSLNDFRVYPNPSNGYINLDYNSFDEENSSVTISLRDIQGRLIFEADDQLINGRLKYVMNVESFTKGVYILSLSGKHIQEVRKLVKN
ncbi:MAG: T9SS type A sorting domain-containing protein [Bacteroidia bacterium]|nr:T9SS type A sorting domain-containing protein [Bacteroidia bacterium]